MSIDPARILTALQNTGLQNKDNPLYQVLRDLIKAVVSITSTSGGGTGGGSSTTIINNNIAQSYDPGNLTLANGQFLIIPERLILSGSERLTLDGNSRLYLVNF